MFSSRDSQKKLIEQQYLGIINSSVTNKGFDSKNWVLEPIGLKMIACPAGGFYMGSPEYELGRNDDEKLHMVIITKPFKIGKYPITQRQYETVMNTNPSYLRGSDYPVEQISWNAAKDFCKKLNKKYAKDIPSGYKFDLPTEAQWEYACRAGTDTALNSGKNLKHDNGFCYNLDEVGWFVGNSDGKTHPIGQKKPNAWGIYDMHGNVWEWCLDSKEDYPDDIIVDPTSVGILTGHINRGGGWFSNASQCRSAFRNTGTPTPNYFSMGLRVVLVQI